VILVDSNVLIDVLNRDLRWFDWSLAQIQRAVHGADLFINPIVIAECAPWVGSYEECSHLLVAMLIRTEMLGADAGYQAGNAYQLYLKRRREQGGGDEIRRTLPDFFIGGHAQSLGATILTRDPRFYRGYFPDVPLITPE
jgi:predicted nucleic acid-binding protein